MYIGCNHTKCIQNGCNHTKCISLSNQKGIIQPAVINLQSNECSQDLYSIHLRLN